MADRADCTTCRHVERAAIELALAGGVTYAAVARKHNLGRESLRRHWLRHVTDARKASLVLGPVQRQALAARVAEESESVLDHHKATRAGLYALYDAAVTAGDRTTGAMLAGRLTEVNNAIGRLTGQLATSPLIQQNTVNVFMHSPEFAQFQLDLIRALSPFPDARAAVLAEFERLESSQPSTLPALEHQHAEEAP